MAALSFRERAGLRRLAITERQSSGYLTSRRSLSVRFATPASPGRSEKLLSESGSRPARGLEPVRHRFGSASVVPFMTIYGTTGLPGRQLGDKAPHRGFRHRLATEVAAPMAAEGRPRCTK